MESYRLEARCLLDILCGKHPCQLDRINYDKLIALADAHEVTALVFYELQKYTRQLPGENYSLLRSRYLGNISVNLTLWKEFLRISGELKKNNIGIVPLKGIDILARFRHFFDLRSMVDIDILIREEQLGQAEKVLSALDYQKELLGLREEYWRRQQCHISFHNKNRVILELHWGLDFKRGGRVLLPRLWERIQEKEASGRKINLLSPEDALFGLALHLRRYGNILSLKQVFDAARLIKESPGFDWDYVLEEARNGKIQSTLYFILTQVRLFTETNISAAIINKLGLALWQKALIERLIKRNTFQIPVMSKKTYLAAHFLLYDNIYEPVHYLINIPYEQFCRFYNLRPYRRKADILYRLRLFYMPVSLPILVSNKAGNGDKIGCILF